MPAVYLVSDTHFGHQGMCNFVKGDGSKVRPWYHVDQMNRDMVELWNSTVKPTDLVIHLGDFVINRRFLPIADSLNGTKILIKGNHDNFTLEEYAAYFKDIKGSHVMNGFLLTHIPVHPNQFGRWKGNIHGHLHSNHMEDVRYMNVCVEQTDYKPILFEQVMARYKERNIE